MNNNNVTVITGEMGNPIKNESGLTLVQTAEGNLMYVKLISPSEESAKVLDGGESHNGATSTMASRDPPEDMEFTEAVTKLLLVLYSNNKDRFRNPHIKKVTLWKELATTMRDHGYNFSAQTIERKFRNMKAHFLKIKDNNTKTGRGRKSWIYYDAMEEIFDQDACVNPTTCVASMPTPKSLLPSKQRAVSPSAALSSIQSSSCRKQSSEPPSGYDMVSKVYRDTEMLPEDAPPETVIEATRKRRLMKNTTPTVHVKRVRQKEPHWLQGIASMQQKQSEEVASIKAAIETSNAIQLERNKLLEKLLYKL